MKFIPPPQISRLLLLTGVIVVGYFGARHFLVPKSYGQYGHFRGDAMKEIAALPISYAGRTACAECHDEVVAKLAGGSHKNVGCESCHGPSQAHIEDPVGVTPKIDDPRFCLRCHQANFSRPAKFPQIDGANHHGDQSQKCITCHQPHAPKETPHK